MKPRTHFIGIVLLFPFFVFAQTAKDNFGIIVKWTPTALVTPVTPTLQLGAEVLLPAFSKHGISVAFDYGLPLQLFNYKPDLTEWGQSVQEEFPDDIYDKQYNKYRGELCKYFNKKKITWFFGAEVFHSSLTYLQTKNHYQSTDGYGYDFDRARINKEVKGVTGKLGVILRIKSWLTFECFAGLGLRNANIVYSDFVNKRIEVSLNHGNYEGPKEGEKIRPHIALGAKLGLRLVR